MKNGLLAVLFAILATPIFAQTLDELNSKAIAAFGAGDVEGTIEILRQVVAADDAQQSEEPEAYLEALNNTTYLVLNGHITNLELSETTARATRFAEDKSQPGAAGWINAFAYESLVQAQSGDLNASRISREKMLQDVPDALRGFAVTFAVDIAFANGDYREMVGFMEEMIETTGRYGAFTDIGALYAKQQELEAEGEIEDVSAIIDGRILIARLVTPNEAEAFAHGALWTKYFMQREAENFAAAASALRDWANTGVLSEEEEESVRSQAAQTLFLAQTEYYSENPAKLLGFAEMAFAFSELAYDPSDPRIAHALRAKADALGVSARYEDALGILQEALAIFEQTPEGQSSTYLVLEDLGSNAWQRGDLAQAADFFARAKEAYRIALENGAEQSSDADVSFIAHNRAQLAIDLEDYALAREEAEASRAAFQSFVDSGKAKTNDLRHWVMLAQLDATIAGAEGDADRAIETALNTVNAVNTYLPKGHPQKVLILQNAVDQLMLFGAPDKARPILNQAKVIANQSMPEDDPIRAEVHIKLAIDALQLGNRDDAIENFRVAVAARKSPGYRNEVALVAGDFEFLAWSLLDTPQPSVEAIDEALSALQWTQVSQSAEALTMTEARLSAADPTQAVLLKARQDARLAFERLSGDLNEAFSSGGETEELLARHAELRGALVEAEAAVVNAGLGNVGLGPVTPLKVAEIQALLQPDEVLVTFLLPSLNPEFIPGLEESSNKVIAIRSDQVAVGVIPEISRGGLNTRISAFRCEMSLSDEGCDVSASGPLRSSLYEDEEGDVDQQFNPAIAEALYSDLFGSVQAALDGQRHLIIALPSDLLRLPYQALITAPADGGALADADWLVRRHAISVLPSIPSLKILRETAQDDEIAETRLLGVGDPVTGAEPDADCGSYSLALRAPTSTGAVYSAQTEDGVRLADPEALRKMSRLPDATCELLAINKVFDEDRGKLLLRAEASETNIKALDASGELAQYSVLAFATHGLVAGEASAVAPGLVMTPPAKASVLDDGLLTSAEVSALTLNARLAILSACNTAAGENAKDEGLSGLATGFFHAGARALMVTHWAVVSRASAEVSVGVASAVSQDAELRNAEALRQAILRILDNPARSPQDKHPAYWAPFAIVGL